MDSTTPELSGRSIVLVGLMGAGKTSVGKRLARRLGMPFTDADTEIVRAAGCSIPDIFNLYGEAAFREGERRVIERLLGEGPMVLATGGGAFMDAGTRDGIRHHGVSVWLRATVDVLARRIGRRGGRPMLAGGEPRAILEGLMDKRYPVYAEADIVVDTGDEPTDSTVEKVIAALNNHARQHPAAPAAVSP